MNSRSKLAALGAASLLIPSLALAGAEKAGTTAANFLATGAGASILGMGGATLALPGGLASAAWNVGALGFVPSTELTLAHAQLAEGTSQEWVAIGGPLGALPTRWSVTGLYQTEGSFEARDAFGGSTGSFNVSSMAIGAQVAQRFRDVVSIGLGAKWVSDNLGTTRGSGVTFDGGVMARARGFGVGFAAQNVGGAMAYDGSQFAFPSSYGAGVSYEHPLSGLRVDLDLNVPSAYYRDVRGGVEWMWRERFALRGGYRAELGAPSGDALTGPTFGAGGGAFGLWFDYGYLINGNGAGQHRMGLSIRSLPRWRPGDPFGQKTMPRQYDEKRPASTAPATSSAKPAPAKPVEKKN